VSIHEDEPHHSPFDKDLQAALEALESATEISRHQFQDLETQKAALHEKNNEESAILFALSKHKIQVELREASEAQLLKSEVWLQRMICSSGCLT